MVTNTYLRDPDLLEESLDDADEVAQAEIAIRNQPLNLHAQYPRYTFSLRPTASISNKTTHAREAFGRGYSSPKY